MSQNHRSFFNHLAPSWNHKQSLHFENVLRDFGIRSADIILDIGTGTGCLLAPLSRLITTGSIFAIDISEKMLSQARKNNTHPGIQFLCADAGDLPLASNMCDKIVCYSTFPHIKNPIAALLEFQRVLGKGGKLLIFHNCCSRKLNHFHAQIPETVSFDKLPKSEILLAMMMNVGFQGVKQVERPDLYWVEAQKVGDG